jgi:ATP-binding cassette subfamily F protein 3
MGHNVAIGYYAQGHESLKMDATILDELLRIKPTMEEERARTFLGRFLFSGDDVFKRIGDLSGGERNRVALAQLTLQSSNLLIMDEPTNHLDISAREALEEVLNAYDGTLLFVSHDRFFIDAVADKLWVVEHGQMVEYLGNYSDYREKQERQQEQQTLKKSREKEKPTKTNTALTEERTRKKRQQQLEREIARLEQEMAQVQAQLDSASVNQDVAQITEIGNQYVALEQQLEEYYAEWADIAE